MDQLPAPVVTKRERRRQEPVGQQGSDLRDDRPCHDRPCERPADEEVVVVRNAVKRFGATTALNDLSITVRRGESHGLVGRNGAGKSTLVSVLTGLRGLDSGSLHFGGQPAPPLTDRKAWMANGVLRLPAPHPGPGHERRREPLPRHLREPPVGELAEPQPQGQHRTGTTGRSRSRPTRRSPNSVSARPR